MENKTQDPKYLIIDGALANAATREFIPEDEPVFILRAKDLRAIPALIYYSSHVVNDEHARAVGKRINDFKRFFDENTDRMKEPDTVILNTWADEYELPRSEPDPEHELSVREFLDGNGLNDND